MRNKKVKVSCPECGEKFFPQGLAPHRARMHGVTRKNFPVASVKGQKTTKKTPLGLEILTDDDPTLGGVIKMVTEKYREANSPAEKANFLKKIYLALEEIENSLLEDVN